MVLISLSRESKSLIDDYIKLGVLSTDNAYNLLRSESFDDILKELSTYLSIDSPFEDRAWRYIRYTLRKGVRSRDDRLTCFSMDDEELMIRLLQNKGVISRRNALEFFDTIYHLDQAVDKLVEMEPIKEIKLTNREVIYMLELKFYQKVRG